MIKFSSVCVGCQWMHILPSRPVFIFCITPVNHLNKKRIYSIYCFGGVVGGVLPFHGQDSKRETAKWVVEERAWHVGQDNRRVSNLGHYEAPSSPHLPSLTLCLISRFPDDHDSVGGGGGGGQQPRLHEPLFSPVVPQVPACKRVRDTAL